MSNYKTIIAELEERGEHELANEMRTAINWKSVGRDVLRNVDNMMLKTKLQNTAIGVRKDGYQIKGVKQTRNGILLRISPRGHNW